MDKVAVTDKDRAVTVIPGDGMLFALVVLDPPATVQSAVQMTWPRGSR